MPVSGTKTSVRLVDGCHGSPEGVVKAAKLMGRIFRDEGPWVMVKVEPLPDMGVPINEQAAQDCANLLAEWGRDDMNESPFDHPAVMDGYPLSSEERQRCEEVAQGAGRLAPRVTADMIERGARVFAGDKAVSELDRRWASMVLRAALEAADA